MLGQHAAQILPDGRIIYFLNNICDKSGNYYSAVRILNPVSRKVVWEFSGVPPHTLHSYTQGYCQYLNDGNVLITVNNEAVDGNGYVIEVTSAGKIVWKWVPPDYDKLVTINEGFTGVIRITKKTL